MPFSLNTLQKLAKLVHSDDESQAVSEKIGMKKDALTTLFEAEESGTEAVETQAASCLEQLQTAYNELTSESVLDWLHAVDATDALDTPELRLQAGTSGAQKVEKQSDQATQALYDAATLGDSGSLTPPATLMETVQARVDAAVAISQAELDHAASLTTENAKLIALREVQTTANGSLTQCTQQPFSILPDTMPFLFAVHSRCNDALGEGSMGTKTAASTDATSTGVLNDTTAGGLIKNAPNLYRLVTGNFANTTTLTGFYQPPRLEFLKGQHHGFGYQELVTRHRATEAVTNYPYAAVAVLNLKNTHDRASTSILSLEGSADSSAYGAGVFIREEEDWQSLFSLTAPHPNFSIQVEIPLLSQHSATVMVVTTAVALNTEDLCQQFLSLTITDLSLGTGVVIDTSSVLSTTQGGL